MSAEELSPEPEPEPVLEPVAATEPEPGPQAEPALYVVACRDDETGVTTYSGPYASYADAVAALPEIAGAEDIPGLDPPRRITLRVGPLHTVPGEDPYGDLGDLDD